MEEESEKTYIAIDLKSFYASVECRDRHLDPLATNLVVANSERTEKTICLAVSPSLKSFGLPGRPRLYEVERRVKEENEKRRMKAPHQRLTGASSHYPDLEANPSLGIDYIIAPPRMARYMEVSTDIYSIYLRHIAPEDIHVYSIDEVFMDVTPYLASSGLSAEALAGTLIGEVLAKTGITATCGIGTNLYLAKVAMDILAKRARADENGVRVACLDERSYREKLWTHRPLTDFWRVGSGYARKLEENHLHTMGDIARASLGGEKSVLNENYLYKLFGVNAELLIDHAWGCESCTMEAIRRFKPEGKSLSQGQVLSHPYPYGKAAVVTREMAETLSLELVKKRLVARRIVLLIGYDRESLTSSYEGEIEADRYGRAVPKSAHGSTNLPHLTSSGRAIAEKTMELFRRIVRKELLVRRVTISVAGLRGEEEARGEFRQMDLFEDDEERAEEAEREKQLQRTVISIKEKFGKNAILKGTNFREGSTMRERNKQIGGHNA